MTKSAPVFAALLLFFALNVGNTNAAVNDDQNFDVPDSNIVLDVQDLNGGVDGVNFILNNIDRGFDADRFLNVDDSRDQNAIGNGNYDVDKNLGDCYDDNRFDDGGNRCDLPDLSSDIKA